MVKKHRFNGNSEKPDVLGLSKEEINFPLSYQLKAIFVHPEQEELHKTRLVETFDSLKIQHQLKDNKLSKKGNYISFTYEVHLENKEQMNRLYDALKKIEGLKFAL